MSLEKFSEKMKEAYALPKLMQVPNSDSIVIAGLGGSAIAGDLLKMYSNSDKISVCRNYNLPSSVTKDTLVILSSYSGNTEEVLSVYREALKKGCNTLAITSGGKLKQFCDQENTKCLRIPGDMQPRMALPYLFLSLLKVLENSGVFPPQEKEVMSAIEAVKEPPKTRAKEIAAKILGKMPIIYATPKMSSVAYRWKNQINENSKKLVLVNTFPELNHNEMMAFAKMSNPEEYYVIFLRDESDHVRNHKRVEITKQILSEKGIKSTEILMKGKSYLARMFSAIILGDWVSYYLAVQSRINPDPIFLIEDFKKKMGPM